MKTTGQGICTAVIMNCGQEGQDRDELSNEDESAYKDRLRGCCTEERERVGVEDVIVSVVT